MFKQLILATTLLSPLAFAEMGSSAVGLTGGMTIETPSTTFLGLDVNSDTKTSYAFGLTSEFGLVPFVYVQPEMLFHKRGNGAGVSYLDLPMLAKVKAGLLPFLNFGALFGPKLAFALEDNVKTFGLDLVVGGEIELDLVPLFSFYVDVRYNLALMDASNVSTATTKLNSIDFLAGVRYHF